MKILRLAFIGLLAGFILSIIAGRSIWLEMRINTGLFLPLATVIAIIAGTLLKRQVPAKVAVAMEILLVFQLLLVYGFDPDALLVVPASIFREGFFLHGLAFFRLNCILAAILLLGNCSLFMPFTFIKRQQKLTDPAL